MKAKDFFGLAIRLLGLWAGYQAFVQLSSLIPALNTGVGFFILILHLGWQLILAYWLLSGAPQIMNRAYPPDDAPPKT
ncbi:MAG TPA: hypothetical protein VF607_13680 [Verrucomicrobiae bacterium]